MLLTSLYSTFLSKFNLESTRD